MAWQELRRGADPARVFSIAFAKGDAPEWLAMSSDKVTCLINSMWSHNPWRWSSEPVPSDCEI
jgi:hypothetical protein